MNLPALRRWWLTVHQIVGLTAGSILALVGLSGALLVFVGPLARWESAALIAPPGAVPVALTADRVERWLGTIARQHPDLASIDAIELPDAGHIPGTVPTVLAHEHIEGRGDVHVLVGLDPHGDGLTGRAVIDDTWWVSLIFFHVSLLTPFGEEAVVWATVGGFLSLISGVVLWWPRGDWRRALALPIGARGRRAWLGWHNAAGIYLLVPMVLALATGLYLMRPGWVEPVIGLAGPIRRPPPAADAPADAPAPERGAQAAALVAAIRTVAAAHPDLLVRSIRAGHDAGDPHLIGLMPPGGDARAAHTDVWVDPAGATILFTRRGDDLRASEWIAGHLVPLHADLTLGWPGRILVLLAGLALPALAITGWVLWLGRRLAARAPAAAPTRISAS